MRRAQATAQRWRHHDCVKIAVTCDGTNYKLHTYNPLDGLMQETMDVTLKQFSITQGILLGNDTSEFGGGRYANMRIWDSELTDAEVKAWMEAVST